MRAYIDIPDDSIRRIAQLKHVSPQVAAKVIVAYLTTFTAHLPEAVALIDSELPTDALTEKLLVETYKIAGWSDS